MEKESKYPAKINRPIYKNIIYRERLFSLLDGEGSEPLIWVSGIAGSGKTTLISSYVDYRKFPCIWYQLDSSDEDPATFFYYLELALKKHYPNQEKSLPQYAKECCPDLAAFTHRFFEVFFSSIDPRTLLVFDSYPDQPDRFIRDVIPNALSRVPEGVRIVGIGRSTPPSSMSVVRVQGNLKELRSDDLRFDSEEFRKAADLYGLHIISDKTMSRMHRRFEGWISGLMMMSESIRRTEIDFKKAVGSDIKEIYDFFAGEIEKNLDQEARNFYLKTSLLPVMTVDIAETLTGYEHAEDILNYLTDHNLFISRRGQQPVVYQYHSLFREYLQSRTGRFMSTEQVETLKRQAAHVLWNSGQYDQAAYYLSQIGDWENLAILISEHAPEIVQSGRYQLLTKWLKYIPENIKQKNAKLSLWEGQCVLPFNPGNSRPFFTRALELTRDTGDAETAYLSWVGSVYSIIFQFNRFYDLDPLIEEMEDLSSRFPEYPSKAIETKVASAMFLALVSRHFDHPEVGSWADKAITLASDYGEKEDQILLAFAEILLHFNLGNMVDMVVKIETQVEPFVNSTRHSSMQALIHYLLGIKEWIKVNPERSLKWIEEGLLLADETNIHTWDLLLLGQGSISAMCSSDLDLTRKYLERMSGIISKGSKYDKSHYHFLLGWDAILRDDRHMARSHIEKALQLKKEIGNIFGIVSNGLGLADVLHSLGENDAAFYQLDQSRKIAEQRGNHFLIYHSGILEAQFLLDNGEDKRAADVLVRVLAVGAAKSIFNFHWFRADVMSRLLAFAINREIEVKYCLDFIRKHNLIPDDQPVDVMEWPWPVKIYSLGRFELIVRGEKVQFSRKAQDRPMDLLKAIIAFGGRKVVSDSLVEAIWPDSDGATGQQALATTLHRLRQLIDVKDAVIFSQGQITLNPELCWVDIWAVERAMGRVNSHLENSTQAVKECEEKSQQIEVALELYKGHFMSSDGNEPWSIGPRERLRSKFIRTLRNYCAHLESRGEDKRAVHWYLKALELENLAEELYQGLILCYLKLDRKADAMATYNRCRENFSVVLGVEPSPATEALHRKILEEEPLDAGTRGRGDAGKSRPR